MTVRRAPLLVGRVTGLDAERGTGEVTADPVEGSVPRPPYRFHVTEIAGGSRTIPVGCRVVFALAARPLGEIEAVSVTPVTPLPPPA